MMSTQQLEQQIEKLVREHIAACHEAAEAAVKRAITAAASSPAPVRRPVKKASSRTHTQRSPEEMARLCEQLYAAVCATPGETMTVLAKRLNSSTLILRGPRKRLQREGRVRSVGSNQYTCYFPMVAPEKVGKSRLVAVGKGA